MLTRLRTFRSSSLSCFGALDPAALDRKVLCASALDPKVLYAATKPRPRQPALRLEWRFKPELEFEFESNDLEVGSSDGPGLG